MALYTKTPGGKNYYELDKEGYVVVEFMDQYGQILNVESALSKLRLSSESIDLSDFPGPPESDSPDSPSSKSDFSDCSLGYGKVPRARYSHSYVGWFHQNGAGCQYW